MTKCINGELGGGGVGGGGGGGSGIWYGNLLVMFNAHLLLFCSMNSEVEPHVRTHSRLVFASVTTKQNLHDQAIIILIS